MMFGQVDSGSDDDDVIEAAIPTPLAAASSSSSGLGEGANVSAPPFFVEPPFDEDQPVVSILYHYFSGVAP